ncbi:MAG: hypothetical protein V3U69_02295 [Bacteroidota bacterium]
MIAKLFRLVKDTVVQYPAILAGYLIYMYYFFVTLDFFENFKLAHLSSSDFLTHFDAVFWMWLLAYAFVKILSYREKSYLHEKLHLIQEHQAREAEWRCNQYQFFTEELKTEINEPIAVATGYVRLIRQQHKNGNGTGAKLDEIDAQLKKVIRGLDGFYSRSRGVE